MKSVVTLAAVLSIAATAAQAHGGAHMHPHGAEGWILFALGMGLASLAWRWVRK